ncbi:hydrolase [Actinoplanes sp. OR16]|uniref:alpha/beta fold hydrolase n=1 Tax=Actinoplanes sp. OR16 TaxID=946334 RepID=UPI000F7061C3|nr:alpha/beta hydrolase [Actinoplanes sp. OR16]BBH69860.1 hydrolase [Actinoplanes sp. OR16]
MPLFPSYDGLHLFFDEKGEGPPLVVLAGGPGTDARYLGDLGGLSATRRLVLLDARAAGRSGVPDDRDTVSFTEQAHDVEHLRRHLGLERLDVLAHSAGCLTAQEYAAAYPGRVRRLILVTPVGRAAREPDPEELAALRDLRRGEPWYEHAAAGDAALRNGGLSPAEEILARARMIPFSWHRWTPEVRRTQYVKGHATSLRWLRDAFYRGSTDEVERLAAAIGEPLIIAGASDGLIGTAPARLAAATYPGSRLEVMTASGHRPWVEQPDHFRALVEEYLSASRAADGLG